VVPVHPNLQTMRRKQRTLKHESTYSGIGLHTGEGVTMRFVPAKEGTGVIFKRVDLPGQPVIPATVEYVCANARNTTLGIADIRIHTVEHVLAALRAYHIDNLCIEIDNIEPPVGNGSSDVFVSMIEKAEIVEQEGYVPIVKLRNPVYWSEGEIHMVAIPCDSYRISYTLNYPNTRLLKSQYFSIDITSDSFKKEISQCRTFSLYEEVSILMDRGLIKGASLENAVVIKDDTILSKGGLFFPDEMVRHKILDVIGDLFLVGYDFQAHIIAIRSGHASNVAFARKLFNYITTENTMEVKDIIKILPHRYPFLLVDRIIDIDLENGSIVGQKNLTINEAFFQGHFPDAPIMPGVLILEALAQTGAVLVHMKAESSTKIGVLLNVNNAKFRQPVRPGDVLILKCHGLHFSSKGGRVRAEAYVGEKIAVEAEIGFAFADKNMI